MNTSDQPKAHPLQRAAQTLMAACLAVMACSVFLNVVLRYGFGSGIAASEELSRLLFVWMVMIAAAGAAHMRIEFFAQAMGRRLRHAIGLALGVLSMALLALMAWKSAGLIELTRHDRYVALGVSVQYLYWAALAGSILWIIAIAWGLRPGHGGADSAS